jgi:hypothetical protein
VSWNLALSNVNHDLVIAGGTLARVTGSAQVRQRVKVALWHYRGEYFLDITQGVPWLQSILGRKTGGDEVGVILRRAILSVPGVLRLVTFSARYDTATRRYEVVAVIQVQPGPGEPSQLVNLDQSINLEAA